MIGNVQERRSVIVPIHNQVQQKNREEHIRYHRQDDMDQDAELARAVNVSRTRIVVGQTAERCIKNKKICTEKVELQYKHADHTVIQSDILQHLYRADIRADDGNSHGNDDNPVNDAAEFETKFCRKIRHYTLYCRLNERATDGIQQGIEDHIFQIECGAVKFNTEIFEYKNEIFERPLLR